MRQTIPIYKRVLLSISIALFTLIVSFTTLPTIDSNQQAHAAGTSEAVFQVAATEFNVPEDLLKSICQEESHISMRDGQKSIDGGYGCHLVKNQAVDTLDQAAKQLGLAPEKLQKDLASNIRGLAYILSTDARQLSSEHQLPTTLEGWRPAVEIFSNSRSRFTAHLYVNRVYQLLKNGFSQTTESGETIVVKPQQLVANAAITTAALSDDPQQVKDLPAGCSNDGKTDYPGALNCILDPQTHDCDIVPGVNAPCNYFSSSHYSPTYRQNDGTITHVVIHDIEGTASAAINTFEDPNSNVAAHYIVDKDGTVYQIVSEKDVAFQAGNLWMNQHSIGIEHEGFDATGFQYYNTAEYQGSAKLTAYLLKKYNIPADRTHIVAHGTVPAPNLANTPNNVDPGPYWLWDYYLKLIGQQQEPLMPSSADQTNKNSHIIALHPKATDSKPLGLNGTETPANFNFFYLYTGPSTKSGLIPQEGTGSDITDETNNVEAAISYYYVNKIKDPAGTGDTLYQIWYGEADQAHANPSSFFTHAKLAWLAVPPATASQGKGTIVTLKSSTGDPIQVSGSPKTNNYYIGDAPAGAIFVSGYKVIEDGTNNVWYSINYNHRQAWVPASQIVATP